MAGKHLARTMERKQKNSHSEITIGEEKPQDLLAFHAFAGCDQTSPFAHYGKKTAWEGWGAMDDVIAAFQALGNAPMVDVVDKVMPINILERYVTIMYDRTRTCRKVNDAQRDIITRKGRYTVAIHPTSDALLRSPVEPDTTQDSTNMSKRQNFDVSVDNENLFRGNKSRKKLSAETRFSTLAARFGSVVLFANCRLY